MAVFSLTLDNYKFANTDGFLRNYGTKKVTNGGSLTTLEFNENMAFLLDRQRPFIITENSVIRNVEYDAKILITEPDLAITIENAKDGITLTIATMYDTIISYNNDKTYKLKSGNVIKLVYFNSQWNFQIRAVDDTPTVDSPNLITSGGVNNALKEKTEYKTLVEKVVWSGNKPAICTEGITIPENAKEICIVGGFPNGGTSINQYPVSALYNLMYDSFHLVSGGSGTTYFSFSFSSSTRILRLDSLMYNGEWIGLDHSFNKMICVLYR